MNNSSSNQTIMVNKDQSKELKLNRLHLDLSVKFGIDLRNREKDQYIIARDNVNQKEVSIRIHSRHADPGEPMVTIDGKEWKTLLDVASSGQYTFTRAAKEVERIKETLEKELKETGKTVYLGAVENEKVKNAAAFEMDEKRNVIVSEINGKPAYDPSVLDKYNFVESAVKEFQKCVFMTKDEYDRMKIVGEEVSISKDRNDLGREKIPSPSLER